MGDVVPFQARRPSVSFRASRSSTIVAPLFWPADVFLLIVSAIPGMIVLLSFIRAALQ